MLEVEREEYDEWMNEKKKSGFSNYCESFYAQKI